MGVKGAAIASVISQALTLVVGVICFLRTAHATTAMHEAWRPNFALMGRVLRYGAANGVQFMLDMVGWTTFMLLIGRISVTALAATNIAFQLNGIAFFPIIGFAMATSTLVGQNLGKNKPDLADRAVWSSIHVSLLYTGAIMLLYIGLPGLLVAPFGAHADPAEFAPVREMTVVILRFVAIYCLFDVGNLIFGSALKGAGDTLYVMLLSTGIMTQLMIAPTVLWCIQPGGPGVYGAWCFLTLAICVLSAAFLLRYRKGHWRNMRVIEHEVI